MAQAKTLKIKKKRWVQILAPPVFNNAYLGEVFVGEPEEAVGRDITVSLMTLTGDPKRQSTHISFSIDSTRDGNLITSIKGMEILPSSVKRLVRRSKERVDDSFEAVTQDGKKLRIKPMVVTRNSTSRSLCAKLKAHSRDFIVRALARTPLDKLVLDLNMFKFQKEMGGHLSKIYPVSICEIRSLKVIGTGTPPVIADEPAQVESEPEGPEPEKAEAQAPAEAPKKRVKAKKAKDEAPADQGAPTESPAEESA